MKNDEFVSNAADCIHEFNWKDPQAGMRVAEHFLILCSANESDPQKTAKLLSSVTALCAVGKVTFAQGMAILTAEDWDSGKEEYVDCVGLRVMRGTDDVQLSVRGSTADGTI